MNGTPRRQRRGRQAPDTDFYPPYLPLSLALGHEHARLRIFTPAHLDRHVLVAPDDKFSFDDDATERRRRRARELDREPAGDPDIHTLLGHAPRVRASERPRIEARITPCVLTGRG